MNSRAANFAIPFHSALAAGLVTVGLGLFAVDSIAQGARIRQGNTRPTQAAIAFPPTLSGGKQVATDTSEDFLKPKGPLKSGVTNAKTPPTIDFMFFPGQDYPGNPWSAWGDNIAANGKYYTSIGDHLAPNGNGFVYEYDPESKTFRQLVNVRKLLNLPEGHYTPGKIHGRLDLGDDGWLYFSTHRGSTRVTTDQYHYLGDWIIRVNPAMDKTEIVAGGGGSTHVLAKAC